MNPDSVSGEILFTGLPGISTLPEFRAEGKEQVQYKERLDLFLPAKKHGIKAEDEEQKCAILLNEKGPKTYNLIRNLIAPGKPDNKSYSDICELVRIHHNPTPSRD